MDFLQPALLAQLQMDLINCVKDWRGLSVLSFAEPSPE
jgi:hypothetical protein